MGISDSSDPKGEFPWHGNGKLPVQEKLQTGFRFIRGNTRQVQTLRQLLPEIVPPGSSGRHRSGTIKKRAIDGLPVEILHALLPACRLRRGDSPTRSSADESNA